MLDYTGAVHRAGVEEEIGMRPRSSLSYRTRCEEASGRLARVRVSSERANIQQAFILDTALNGGP